jgi:Fe-S cluster assembly protein SufD
VTITVDRSPSAPSSGTTGFAGLIERSSQVTAPAWLTELRQSGAARFAATGIPTTRDEEWRFTPVTAIGDTAWQAVESAGAVDKSRIDELSFDASWPAIVLVDGIHSAELSRSATLPQGVTVQSLSEAIAADHPAVAAHLGRTADANQTPFTALNAATFGDGLFVHVAAGVAVELPLVFLHVTTGASDDALLAPRVLVVMESGARATVIERYVSTAPGQHFTNTVVEVSMASGSWLEHLRIQDENHASWHIGFTQVNQATDSHYRSFALSLGGRLARHNLHARHLEPRVETLFYGLYLTRGSQLADTHSAIFHDQPDCNSWEVYKGVLADRSRGVFNGKVFVQPIAQKTDAKQTNRNLLLSDQAKVDTKPQLEIFADDVKCTHGATVGRLNEQQRYYLKSRGIGGQEAEKLLIWAFAAEVLAEVQQPLVRAELERLVHAELDEMTG